MLRALCGLGVVAALVACLVPGTVGASEVSGFYMEARTCQVYTGPCFANGEVGLAGKSAVMAWSIEDGKHDGVDLTGLKVIMAVRSTDTLGFRGIDGAGLVKSVIMVDKKATSRQQAALVAFAKKHSGKAGKAVVRVDALPIEMSLDRVELNGKLKAGDKVELVTRKARPEDCICSNESAYYPPLDTKLEGFVPGVTIKGKFKGRGLGTRWTIPDSRSAYMATFSY